MGALRPGGEPGATDQSSRPPQGSGTSEGSTLSHVSCSFLLLPHCLLEPPDLPTPIADLRPGWENGTREPRKAVSQGPHPGKDFQVIQVPASDLGPR